MRRLLPALRANAADRQYGLSRRVLNLERAPVRIPATQVRAVIKKAAPMVTPSSLDIFYPGFIYRIASNTWETLANDGDEFLQGFLLPAGIIGLTFYMNPGDGSLWRSTDRGVTWETVLATGFLSMDGDGPIDMAITPSGIVFALSDNSPARIYRSTDQGDNWSQVYEFSGGNAGGQAYISPCPTDSNRVACIGFDGGSIKAVVSTDGGDTWGSEVEVTADGRASCSLAWFNGSLAVLTDEPNAGDLERHRIYTSDDDGASWSTAMTDAAAPGEEIYSGIVTYENNVLVMSVKDKAYRTTDGAAFSTITPPVGGGAGAQIKGLVLVNGVLWTITKDGSFYRGSTAKTDAPLAPDTAVVGLVQI